MPAPDLAQINALVKNVAASLEAAFGPLTKADGDPPPDNDADDAGSPPAASAAPPSPADSPDPAASPDAPPAADPAAAAGGDPAADAGQGVTVESLMSEYAALPLPMLQMHLQAAEAAYQQVAGGDPAASAGGAPPPGAGAPPPGAGGPPPDMSASPGGPPPGMGKSEIVLPANLMATIAGLQKSVEQIGGLRKSLVDVNAKLVARDGELQATKAALAKAQGDMEKMAVDTDKVAKGVSAILARPGVLRKSASRMSDVAVSGKPGTPTEAATVAGLAAETPRAVVIQHLNKFTREGHSLSKSDSATLKTYICNAQTPVQPVLEILAKFPTQ